MCFHSAYFQLVRRSTDLSTWCQFSRNLWRQECVRLAFVPKHSNAPLGKRAVRMIEYSPEHFDALQTVAKMYRRTLQSPVTDHLLTTIMRAATWCKLFMILADDGSAICHNRPREDAFPI